MTTESIVEAQDTDEGVDELIMALEASHRGTEATGDEDLGTEDETNDTETEVEATDSEGEDKGTVEDGQAGDEKAEEAEEDEVVEDAAAEAARTMAEDNRELKTLLRQVTQNNEILAARLARLERGYKAKTVAGNEGEDEGDFDEAGGTKKVVQEEPELSNIEVLQESIANIREQRAESFNLMVEIMENNPSFADVREVCSQSNFEDLVDVIATDVSEKNGISPSEANMAVQLKIWEQPNPYKYVYNLVKKYHPNYAEKEEAAAGKEGEEKVVKEGKSKSAKDVVKKAPGSVADMGSGGANKSGWTAARIDALPESELGKVPPDIYERYMADELE